MPGTAESKNDNAPTSSINLTDIESFSFLFNAIWQTQQNKVPRCQLNLLDTILFHDGTPYRWLFTSSKTGEIMKKKNSRLCYQEVVKSFKARTSILNENKDGNVSPGPVATIWYVESAAVIKASVVDEKELRRLFGSKQALNSVLAIQIYLSRSSLKGSGVFEHRIMVNQDGRRQQQTTEFVNHVDDTQITTFSEGVQRVAVTEAQQNSLKSVSRKLVKAIEDSSRCTVASLVVQVSFDASWTPYIVAARDIILWNAPSDWHGSQPCRNSMIYASGLCPTMCTSSSDLQDGYKHFEEGKSEALKSQVTDSSLTARVISPHDKSAMSTESTNTSAEESADEKILSSFGIEGITQSEGESSSLETSQNLLSSVAQTEDLEEGTILKCDANNSSNSIITKKKLRNRTQSIGEIMIDFFKMMETKDVRTQHLTSDIYPELSDDDSDEDSSRILPIAKVVKKEKLGTCGGQGSASDLDVVAQDSPGSDAEASQAGQDECKTSDISMGKMSPKKLRSGLEHGDGLGMESSPGSGLGPVHVSGGCQGSYCQVVRAVGDVEGSKESTERRKSQGSRVGHSLSVCPYQMAFKSVLFDRAEDKLLGLSFKQKLREDILGCDGRADQVVLTFARTQIQRVAEFLKGQTNDASSAYSDDLSGHSLQYLYHKLVYNEALAQVPLNRFYQPVALCEACYKTYGRLDHERGEAFLKDSCSLPEQTRETVTASESQSILKTRSQSFSADSDALKSGDLAADSSDNLRRSKSTNKMGESSVPHELGSRRSAKGDQKRPKPHSIKETPSMPKIRSVEADAQPRTHTHTHSHSQTHSRTHTPQRSIPSSSSSSSSSTRHAKDNRESPSAPELERILSTPGPAPRLPAPVKLFPVGTIDLGSTATDRLSTTTSGQRLDRLVSRSEFNINDTSNFIFEAYKISRSSSNGRRQQATGERSYRGRAGSPECRSATMKPLSYRVERALEPYSAAAGARPKVSRPLSVQQSRTKMKEEGWNQCHHVVQEFERQVVLQKRIDSNREQRLEQLKLLHLSYDQIKEQRLAKEERQSQRQQQLVLREREKRSCGDKQGAQQRGKREQISGLDFEELMAKSMTPHRAEKEAKKEEEDEEREYLLEQEQFEVDDDELGDDEEKEMGRNEEELKEKVKENSDTIILSKEVNQTHGMLQGDVKHQLPLEEKIKSPPTTSHSEQQQQDATLPSLVRETESQRVHRSPRAVLNDLQVQVDEPHNLQTRAEAADVKKIVEKKSKESSPSVHQIEESQKTNTECGTQDPQEQAEEVTIMDTAGEKECPQVIRSRSNSLPSGAFRPQSAAYLIAQREACQGSLETSQSGEGKDAFSPDSSPLKGTMSRSPVIGLGIPQQSQYYLGESDSFADFHPRKGGFAHHPFTPVLQSSKDDVKCALEGKDDSDLPTIHAPDIRVVEGEVPDITCESKKNISARKTPAGVGGGGGVGG